jgi:fluoroacetyl-CoA thioesterase
MSIAIGTTATATLVVTESDLASAIAQQHGDGFPPVLATACMVALMELAASRVLIPMLTGDELSVGVTVDIAHTAATPVGQTVTAEATYFGMDGKLHRFEIIARDSGGEIGRGTHKRAIVSSARLVAGALKRCGGGIA